MSTVEQIIEKQKLDSCKYSKLSAQSTLQNSPNRTNIRAILITHTHNANIPIFNSVIFEMKEDIASILNLEEYTFS